MLHVNQIKEIASVLQSSGDTNKETQAVLLGYVLGLEAPLQLSMDNVDDKVEWNSFFNDIPGDINEHYMINLALVQDIAKLTLLYRQSVAAGDDRIEERASRFLKLAGASFGMLGKEGSVRSIRKVLNWLLTERREAIVERIEARNAVQS
nr:MAG TPA: hypothetical protein [Caudoviricetes sp.]